MAMTSPTERIVAAASPSPQTVHVPVFAGFFDDDVTIHVGDTVQWDWVFPLFHDITTVNGSAESFDSGVLTDTYSHTFLGPGTIVYYCRIHGTDNLDGTATGMTATVTVLPVPEPTGIAVAALGGMTVTCGRRRRGA
jgi:plastocyanin